MRKLKWDKRDWRYRRRGFWTEDSSISRFLFNNFAEERGRKKVGLEMCLNSTAFFHWFVIRETPSNCLFRFGFSGF